MVEKEQWAKSHWRGFALGAVSALALIGVGGAGYALAQHEDEPTTEMRAIERQLSHPDEFTEIAYETNVSATQLQSDFDQLMGYSRQDVPDSDESIAVFTHDLDETDVHDMMHAYLDGLMLQRRKYNRMVGLLEKDIDYIATFDDVPLDESPDVQNLDAPLVEAVMGEIAATPLMLHESDDSLSVWIDYDALKQRYADIMDDFHLNLILLHDDIMRYGYTRGDGSLDVEAVYHRLRLIDKIQDGDHTLDDFYWEEERYQLAVLLTGYGMDERPEWDDEYLYYLEQVAEDTSNTLYADITRELIDSVLEEGEYGEDTIRIANQWMNDTFTDYIQHLESTQD